MFTPDEMKWLNRRLDAEVQLAIEEFRERVLALKPDFAPHMLDYMVYEALKSAHQA